MNTAPPHGSSAPASAHSPRSLSVIIPVFNEEAVIAQTHQRLSSVMRSLNRPYELIFVNDGSSDASDPILLSIAASDPNSKILSFSRNFGHQPAITAGLHAASGSAAITIDADLQDPPELIPAMLDLMAREHADVVFAVRKKRAGEPKLKLAFAKSFYRLLNRLSDTPLPVDSGDFRLMNRPVMDAFNRLGEHDKYVRGLVSWLGFKQVPVYYDRDARAAGETKYPFRKSLQLGLTGIFYFSKKPLMLAVSLGFLCIAAGLCYAAVVLWQKITGVPGLASGWSSLICVTIFFSGVQLLTVGILGQYIGSLFDEAKRRPEYIISRKTNFGEPPHGTPGARPDLS
ncbi:MAG: glycosyltransferase family 2 protein [Opitutaceae bacterium]|nr:glycosyltransferase family 2 protein [Opitutaceae bacterium]